MSLRVWLRSFVLRVVDDNGWACFDGWRWFVVVEQPVGAWCVVRRVGATALLLSVSAVVCVAFMVWGLGRTLQSLFE